MDDLPYGWRGKIGLIYIASAYSMEVEFNKMAPQGVTSHTTRVALSDQPECFSIEDLSNLKDDVLHATKILAQAPLNAIAFGCTSGSFVNGPEYDKQLVRSMESIANIPCTTTATAVVNALQNMNIQNIAVATPYTKEVNQLAKEYFSKAGFHITNMTGLGIADDYAISELDSKTIYEMAMNADTEDADALFLSCTGLSAVHIIEAFEEDLQKPVITSNQATFWHTLRLSKIASKVKGFGQLFSY